MWAEDVVIVYCWADVGITKVIAGMIDSATIVKMVMAVNLFRVLFIFLTHLRFSYCFLRVLRVGSTHVCICVHNSFIYSLA